MKEVAEMGISFGLTSAVLTTVGLFTGLVTSLESQAAVISGVLLIAIVDALSDSMGMHLARESEEKTVTSDVWRITFDTFLTKFVVALSFLVPLVFFELTTAMYFSFAWGAFLLAIFSYHIAKRKNEKPMQVIAEHLIAGFFVILLTYFLGLGIHYFVSII